MSRQLGCVNTCWVSLPSMKDELSLHLPPTLPLCQKQPLYRLPGSKLPRKIKASWKGISCHLRTKVRQGEFWDLALHSTYPFTNSQVNVSGCWEQRWNPTAQRTGVSSGKITMQCHLQNSSSLAEPFLCAKHHPVLQVLSLSDPSRQP